MGARAVKARALILVSAGIGGTCPGSTPNRAFSGMVCGVVAIRAAARCGSRVEMGRLAGTSVGRSSLRNQALVAYPPQVLRPLVGTLFVGCITGAVGLGA